MSAPRFAPTATSRSQTESSDKRYYQSPDVVPSSWTPDKPGIVEGFQPDGPLLGAQGPDQGFALRIARQLQPEFHLQEGERADDAIRGCLGIALKRASLYSRAPTVHDVRLAFTIWGFFDPNPPADLVARRRYLFEGVGLVNHHYLQAREITDLVPESTLRMTPKDASAAYPKRWKELTGG